MRRVYIIFCIALMVGCTNEINFTNDLQENNQDKPLNSISLDDALISLSEYQSLQSKSNDKEIENIVYISNPNYNGGCVKSSDIQQEDNPYLLYVVNYTDDEGYAVLSADRRLPTDIYAIAENGNVEESDIYGENEEDFPIALLYESARGNISVTDSTTTDPVIPNPGEPIEPGNPMDPDLGEWIVTTWGPWHVYESVPTKLLTKWHQNSPFNDLVQPNYAGCTTIALLQILAYNEYPVDHYISQLLVPFHLMKYQEVILADTPYAQSAALFVKEFHDMRADYHISGNSTLVFPDEARDHMEWLGYQNVVLHRDGTNCNMSRIYSSLDNDYPVLISAMADKITAGGHSWVIDGYRKERRFGAKYGEETGDYYGQEVEEREMVHCNWGWSGGLHNGYFYAGVFSSHNPVIPDQTQMGGDPHLYNQFYRVITYQLPSN